MVSHPVIAHHADPRPFFLSAHRLRFHFQIEARHVVQQ